MHRSARLELMAIELLQIVQGFMVRAVHVAGKDNPADAPSRGLSTKIPSEDWTSHFFSQSCLRAPDVNGFADPTGYNLAAPDGFLTNIQ